MHAKKTKAAIVRSDFEQRTPPKDQTGFLQTSTKLYELKASPTYVLNFSTRDQNDKVLHREEPLR